MKKKILSLLLAFAMVLPLVPPFELPVFAEEAHAPEEVAAPVISDTKSEATSGYYTYTVSDGKATITDVDSSISGYVTIRSTLGGYPVTRIDNYAFQGCTRLTAVTVPDSVTSIGIGAFTSCTGLTSIIIPDSVTSIGDNVFEICTALESIEVEKENPVYHSSGNCLVETESKTLIFGCKTSVIPTDGSVTTIGDDAFEDCTSLTSIIIPDSVTSIGKYAFQGCSGLTSIVIPDSVTTIGSNAFYGCTGLTTVSIGNGVTSIGSYAFYGCSGLKKVNISSVEAWCGISFDNYASNPLYYAKNLYLSDVLLTDLVIPDGVTSIGDYAFSGCTGLTSVTIGNGVTSIGEEAFYRCESLTSVTIGNSVTSIGDSAFSGCKGLTTVTIGNSVTSIGDWAFSGCTGLTDLTIPDSVTSIGSSAFSGTAWLNAQPDGVVYAGKVVYDVKGTCPSEIALKDGTVAIADEAFYYCTGLTSIVIPDSVTAIGGSAFSGCTGLISITIGNSVTSIGDWAFSGCKGLTSVTIGNGVTSIGDSAFQNCTSLTTVTIPGSVTSIGSYAFSGCTGLTSITIPESVTSIGERAFERCTGLTEVWYEGTTSDRQNISIGSSNTMLTDATWHYNSCVIHVYDNACDTTCGVCGFVRTAPHDYTNTCDTTCNECGAVRTAPHDYTNTCDTTCNVCGQVRTITHDYSVQEKDETEHWMKCSVCGAIDESNREAHIHDNSCDTDCNICGEIRTITHTYDNTCDTTCNVCGQVRTITHDYSVLDKSETEHWMKCSVCGAIDESNREAHIHDNACDTTCNVCGQVRTVPNHVFTDANDRECNHCQIYRYRIEFDANGGTAAPDTQMKIEGKAVSLSSQKPTRNGYMFVGWGTTEKCGKMYSPGEEYFVDEDRTFFALWYEGKICETCNGKGEISELCSSCNGIGYETRYSCPYCGGHVAKHIVGTGVLGYTCSRCGFVSPVTKEEDCISCRDGCRYDDCSDCGGKGALANEEKKIAAPTILSFTDTTVTILPVEGVEYSCNGIDWQESNVFTNLSPGTKYTFYLRLAPSGSTPFSAMGRRTEITVDKSNQNLIPDVPTVQSFTASSITLTPVDGCEYSKDGTTWQTSNVFGDLSCATEYTFYQRYKETSFIYAGKSSEGLKARTEKGTQNAPSAPTLSQKTHNSITLNAISGYEYSRDGLTWQSSNIFTGLNPETNYMFYQRKAETERYYASAASPSITVKTTEEPAYTPGDLDGVEGVTSADAIYLLYHTLLGSDRYPVDQPVDYNKDGAISSADAIYLLYHTLLGNDRYPI